jgi:chaperonin cofactor prefoldin
MSFIKDTIIKELREDKGQLTLINKSQKLYIHELRESIENLNIHIETLNEINEKYAKIITKLREKLKKEIFSLSEE